MSTDRDTTRIVRSWLEEGVTALPDRVLDTVLDQLPATHQRRSWWPPRRFALMNKIVPIAAAAAAVLVLAIVGYNLLPGGAFGGPPRPNPSATPSPVPSIPALGSGLLQPGRYAWYWSGPRVSFEVPSGWTAVAGRDIMNNTESASEIAWGAWLPDSLPVTHVYTDACRSEGNLDPIGPTVQDLVAAVDSQASTDASITDVVIGGLAAKRVEVVQSPGVDDRAACRHGVGGPLQIWADPAETGYFALKPEYSGLIHVLDVGAYRVVFTTVLGPDVTTEDTAELEDIISSIVFDTVAAGPSTAP